jgi:heme exporter protein D
MKWSSWQAFVAMDGYGLYVWGSVLVVLVFLAAELAALTWRRRTILNNLRSER